MPSLNENTSDSWFLLAFLVVLIVGLLCTAAGLLTGLREKEKRR